MSKKKNDSYTLVQILWIIIKKIIHLALVLVRGILYYTMKILYRIFRLWEFEREKDEVFIVKDNLTHSFNFKRSIKFKTLYHDLQYELNMFHVYVECDINNGTNESEEKMDEILTSVDELIVLAESESIKRAFSFANKRKNGMPYTSKNETEMAFYLENYMRGYGSDVGNDLDEMKE